MSYHNTSSSTPSNIKQSVTNTAGQTAPAGYHYMPDGTLMSDAEHEKLYGVKTINSLKLNLSSLPASGSTRNFWINGEDGASFSLEIRNEDFKYYNFITNKFQVAASRLKKAIGKDGFYSGSISFPSVGDDDHYDLYLFADVGSQHSKHNEVRFKDNTVDINSSTGSNSLLLKKVIYQHLDVTVTIRPFSSSGGIELGSIVNDATVTQRSAVVAKKPFSISCAVTTAAKCYQIIKQPTSNDVIGFVSANVGATPISIPTENIYPTATAAFTGDDVNGAVTSGSVVRMDNTDLSAVIKVGDKITTPVTTDTVNGDFSGGATAITMDAGVATKMAVGDQVTGTAVLNAGVFTVASIDSTNVFSLSSSAAIDDGTTLSFSSKINRSLTTVTVVETSGTATDFTMSQAIQFRDNAPLTFTPQMNYKWPIDNAVHIVKKDMIIATGTTVLADSYLADYRSTITNFPGTDDENVIVLEQLPAVDTLGLPPTYTNGEVTAQAGAITFNQQQPLVVAEQPLKIGGYGEGELLRATGHDVVFSDLAIALTPITTTTTAAVNNSTSVPVTSRNGILDDVSTVSGIGINPALVDPTVDTGAGAVTGAGTLVLTAAQTLENGATLTFSGAGQTATITGNIEIKGVGTASGGLRFDVDRLLSIT